MINVELIFMIKSTQFGNKYITEDHYHNFHKHN